MKTTPNALTKQDNTLKTNFEVLHNNYCIDENELMLLVGAEKVKLFQKKIKQALADYPEVYAITTMCENVQKENERLQEENKERLDENIELGKIIDDLKYTISQNEKTVELAKDGAKTIQSLNSEIKRLEMEQEKQTEKQEAEYSTLYEAYKALHQKHSELVNDVNSNKGLLKAWRQSSYIKQLEAKVANHKKGGRKPTEQEKIDEIRELKQLGKTNYRIAKMVGVAESTVAKYLK